MNMREDNNFEEYTSRFTLQELKEQDELVERKTEEMLNSGDEILKIFHERCSKAFVESRGIDVYGIEIIGASFLEHGEIDPDFQGDVLLSLVKLKDLPPCIMATVDGVLIDMYSPDIMFEKTNAKEDVFTYLAQDKVHFQNNNILFKRDGEILENHTGNYDIEHRKDLQLLNWE